jgi:hypothetical protein
MPSITSIAVYLARSSWKSIERITRPSAMRMADFLDRVDGICSN